MGVDWGHGMVSVSLPYSEWRIANCFRGAELTAEDISEMQRRIITENKEWKRRKSREENAGGFDEDEIARQRKYARRRADRRKLTCGHPIDDVAGIWGS